MTLAKEVCANNPIRKNVESLILQYYASGENDGFSIEDVMCRYISMEESLTYFRNKKPYLRLVDGTNKTIINTLIENDIETIEQLHNADDTQLLKLKSIGKVSLTKIRACLSLILD